MPAEICLSTQVLFFKEQKLTFLVNITGTSEALTLRHQNQMPGQNRLLTRHMSSLSKFLSDSRFRLALKTSLPTLKSCSHAALAGTPGLNLNTLDTLDRGLKAFCGDLSGEFIKASTSSTLSSKKMYIIQVCFYNKYIYIHNK